MSEKTVTLKVKSPLGGQIVDLARVPDPVFADKMVGDGFSIDPTTDVLLAPISGVVASLHSSQHAVSVKSDEGFEVLMHVGLETVKLKGQGFEAQVKTGDKVKAGDPLIKFDIGYVAKSSKSLLTQVVVTNMDQVKNLKIINSGTCNGMDEIILLEGVDQGFTADASDEGVLESNPIEVLNHTGLHARPSAIIVNTAKLFKSKIQICKEGKCVNARSLVGIMGLEVACNDSLTIKASGPDAQAAIDELKVQIINGLGEDISQSKSLVEEAESKPEADEIEEKELTLEDLGDTLSGVCASPGAGYGELLVIEDKKIEIDEKGKGSDIELKELNEALKAGKKHISELQSKLEEQGNKDKAAIFAAHIDIMEDPDLADSAEEKINAGYSAAYAWKSSYTSMAASLAGLKNEILAGRANDVGDVGMRVLKILTKTSDEERVIADKTILIAEDLTPSDTMTLDKNKIMGFCTVAGGSTSHVAILARSLGIPAIAGIPKCALGLKSGANVILDADQGSLNIKPTDEAIQQVKTAIETEKKQHEKDMEKAHEHALTTDGERILVYANIVAPSDADEAVRLGAEGVGLLRSEFLFMQRDKGPSVEEQSNIYSKITKTMGQERPIIIRTLDVGGDKPLKYLSFPKEENPFLGLRGIRVSLDQPKLLREQLRALLESAKDGPIAIMFPMVGFIGEIRAAKAILEEEKVKMGFTQPIKVGMMIEVPSAALRADIFAPEVDFFSIGSNDLTQYTLAIDRGHTQLAAQVDGLDPAVLELIRITARAGIKHGKMVAVCGGLASDPQAVPVLMGLGVEELSISCSMIPRIKSNIRRYSMKDCKELAESVLKQEDAQGVRKLCKEFMAKHI